MQERAPILTKTPRALLALMAALAPVALAAWWAPAAAAAPEKPADALEVKLWTADENELPALEKAVVRLIQVTPDSARAHQLLAHVMVRLFSKDPSDLYLLKQAADIAQQAIDLAPREPVGYVALAEILDLMGNADRAMQLLDEAEAAGVKPNWRFAFTRARLASDPTGAGAGKVLKQMEKALSYPDSEPRIVVPYVVALLQTDSTGEQLIAKLEDWNRRFPSPLFQLTMAITESDLGKTQLAHALYGKILKADPGNKEAMVNDAILLYRDLKDGARAAAMLQQVLKDHVAEFAPPVRAMITAHLGAAYVRQKEWDKAQAAFARAMSGSEMEGNGLLEFITQTYRQANAQVQLVALIRQLNDTMRGTGVLYALLGETLSESLQKHDEALKAFSDAITLDPDRSDYYNGMGLTYYRKKAYPAALKLFEAASEVDPNDATARYNEACVLSLMGRRDDAINTLAEALTLDPRLTQSARADADFSGLQASPKFLELLQAMAH